MVILKGEGDSRRHGAGKYSGLQKPYYLRSAESDARSEAANRRTASVSQPTIAMIRG